MNKLRPVFKKDGLVTAATASGIVDGAASVLVVSEDFVQKHVRAISIKKSSSEFNFFLRSSIRS